MSAAGGLLGGEIDAHLLLSSKLRGISLALDDDSLGGPSKMFMTKSLLGGEMDRRKSETPHAPSLPLPFMILIMNYVAGHDTAINWRKKRARHFLLRCVNTIYLVLILDSF